MLSPTFGNYRAMNSLEPKWLHGSEFDWSMLAFVQFCQVRRVKGIPGTKTLKTLKASRHQGIRRADILSFFLIYWRSFWCTEDPASTLLRDTS